MSGVFWISAILFVFLFVGSISSTFNQAKSEGKGTMDALAETVLIFLISAIVVGGVFYWFFHKVLSS